MKKQIILGLVLLLIANISFAQKKNSKTIEPDSVITKMLNDKSFTINAKTALPNYGRSVSLDNRYSVEIKGDSVLSYLPYFGRAYRLPYGGGEGLIFNSTTTNYKIKQVKKGGTEIKFSTRTGEDTYEYIIVVYPGGSSNIKVSSNNKQSIDFFGQLEF